MTSSTIHPCFLYTPLEVSDNPDKEKVPRGFICLQTDDTANVGNHLFMEREAKASIRFDFKSPQFLTIDNPVTFNRETISKRGSNVHLYQASLFKELSVISDIPLNKPSFISERAREVYIAAVFCPNLSFEFSVCSQYIDPDANVVNRLNNFINRAIAIANVTLTFVFLNIKTIRLAVFADASLANSSNLSFQLSTWIHFSSIRR